MTTEFELTSTSAGLGCPPPTASGAAGAGPTASASSDGSGADPAGRVDTVSAFGPRVQLRLTATRRSTGPGFGHERGGSGIDAQRSFGGGHVPAVRIGGRLSHGRTGIRIDVRRLRTAGRQRTD